MRSDAAAWGLASWKLPVAWQASFALRDPDELVIRCCESDPLGIRALAAERVRLRCLLLDLDRVHLRATARVVAGLCALTAEAQGGEGPARASTAKAAAAWLRSEVDGAVDALVEEEWQLARSGRTQVSKGSAFAVFALPHGAEPQELRAGCARFNRCDEPVRRAFFLLVVRRVPLEEAARGEGVLALRLAERARSAFQALLGKVKSPLESAPGGSLAAGSSHV